MRAFFMPARLVGRCHVKRFKMLEHKNQNEEDTYKRCFSFFVKILLNEGRNKHMLFIVLADPVL